LGKFNTLGEKFNTGEQFNDASAVLTHMDGALAYLQVVAAAGKRGGLR
jgi:hypothetical protein